MPGKEKGKRGTPTCPSLGYLAPSIVYFSTIFHLLDKMDSVLIGASTERPLRREVTADDSSLRSLDIAEEAIFSYDVSQNPKAGYHKFENVYFAISVQRQTFRGVFTQIEDFSDNEHSNELLRIHYYEKDIHAL